MSTELGKYEAIGELSKGDADGQFGPTYANIKRATTGALYAIAEDAPATLCSNFMAAHAKHASRPCLGYRPLVNGEVGPLGVRSRKEST